MAKHLASNKLPGSGLKREHEQIKQQRSIASRLLNGMNNLVQTECLRSMTGSGHDSRIATSATEDMCSMQSDCLPSMTGNDHDS